MAKKVKLTPFHYHEALDRSYLVFEVFSEYIQSHPAVRQTPELRTAADKIGQQLFELYQALGQISLK